MFATQKGRSNPSRISCRRWEKVTVSPDRYTDCTADPCRPVCPANEAPRSQSSVHFLRRQPRHPDHLIPAGLAGSNSNGRTRHIQKFCEEIDACLIGFAVYGWGGQREFERIA